MTFFKNAQVIFVLFVFVYYNYTHTFDQHSHTRRNLTPLTILFSTVCIGGKGGEGCRGKFKRCGLNFRIPKVQLVGLMVLD